MGVLCARGVLCKHTRCAPTFFFYTLALVPLRCSDTATLHHVRNMMGEAEEMGSSTLNELQQQRETIIRTTTKTSAINSLTDTAKRIVIGIQGRMCVNNFILST
ncbi:hypothetical protein EON67_02460 [archaeon]|nr:MAG: hypothetical protein EON67_02460 [archaeon]